jgi:hypothetical protein
MTNAFPGTQPEQSLSQRPVRGEGARISAGGQTVRDGVRHVTTAVVARPYRAANDSPTKATRDDPRPVSEENATLTRSATSVQHGAVRAWSLKMRVLAPCAVVFSTLGNADARASDATAADRVLATELFNEGRSLMAEKQYSKACRKLEESEHLDPGGGTLLNLALCHELEGRTATAWSEFHDALAMARRDGRADREDQAQHHIQALEPRLTRLVITVPADAQLPDLVVQRDGSPIGSAAWGAAAPIDPGRHVVAAQAPGRVGWQTTIDISGEGTQKTVTVPILELLPSSSPTAPTVAAPVALQVLPTPPTDSAHRTWQRPAALVVGGLGVVGVAVGAFFGLEAQNGWRDAQPRCLQNVCDDQGYRAWTDATRNATVSTIAFAVGGAAIAGGAVLWLTAPAAVGSVHVGGAASRGMARVVVGADF